MEKNIRIAQMQVSKEKNDTLVASGVGSGIGLAVYDPVSKVGGILHFILPDSTLEKGAAEKQPLMFADTGIPELLEAFSALGGQKDRIKVLAIGGSEIMNQSEPHSIGKKNRTALAKCLVAVDIDLDIEDMGGNVNRSLKLEIDTGDVFVKTSRNPQEVKI
ncbi:MAG: chemotaxis protein CheD [Desulfobacteraceae bacterium]|nr:MAG: chemotaxis protein CheD [Desulfobacteraceae bacterium]